MRLRRGSRWWLVVAAAAIMGVAGTFQFAWSTLRLPLGARIGAPEASLGTIFTLYVVFQTTSQYPAGWARDRYGPRIPLAVGGLLMVAGYAIVAVASALPQAYLGYIVGGIGAGAAYSVAVNTPVKWFHERRGLATGIVMMSYAGLSFLLIPGLRRGVDDDFVRTVLVLAGLAGITALVASVTLRDPNGDAGNDDDPNENARKEAESEDETRASDAAYEWRETIRTWQFWLMYAVFVLVNGVGLMLIGKVVTLAAELDLPAAAGTYAASGVALADAVGIGVLGALSDRLGRERTLGASLAAAGVALAAGIVAGAGEHWSAFVALVAAAAFFRGPAFSILPTMVAEYYGPARSSENYGLLYTAKLWGGLFGGASASALVITIGWSESFLLGAVLLVAAGGASFTLRPVRPK